MPPKGEICRAGAGAAAARIAYTRLVRRVLFLFVPGLMGWRWARAAAKLINLFSTWYSCNL